MGSSWSGWNLPAADLSQLGHWRQGVGLARGTRALLPAGSDSEPGAKTTWTSQEGLGPGLGQQEVLCLTLTGVCSASVRIWTPEWKKKNILRQPKQPQAVTSSRSEFNSSATPPGLPGELFLLYFTATGLKTPLGTDFPGVWQHLLGATCGRGTTGSMRGESKHRLRH